VVKLGGYEPQNHTSGLLCPVKTSCMGLFKLLETGLSTARQRWGSLHDYSCVVTSERSYSFL